MAASNGRKTSSSNRKRTKSTAAKASGRKRKTNTAAQDSALFHEIELVVLLAAMVFLFCCNFGLVGPVGDAVSGVLFGIFGLTAYVLPVLLFFAVAFWFANAGNSSAVRKLTAGIVLFLMAGIVCDLIAKGAAGMEEYSAGALYENCRETKGGGGVIGGSISFLLLGYLETIGTILVVLLCTVVSLILLTEKSLLGSVKRGGSRMRELSREESERRREMAEERRLEQEERTRRRREMAEERRTEQEENRIRRREEEKSRRQAQEEQRAQKAAERRLKAEEKENEKILRMDRREGVSLDTVLFRSEDTHRRNDMHEIILSEEELGIVRNQEDTPAAASAEETAACGTGEIHTHGTKRADTDNRAVKTQSAGGENGNGDAGTVERALSAIRIHRAESEAAVPGPEPVSAEERKTESEAEEIYAARLRAMQRQAYFSAADSDACQEVQAVSSADGMAEKEETAERFGFGGHAGRVMPEGAEQGISAVRQGEIQTDQRNSAEPGNGAGREIRREPELQADRRSLGEPGNGADREIRRESEPQADRRSSAEPGNGAGREIRRESEPQADRRSLGEPGNGADREIRRESEPQADRRSSGESGNPSVWENRVEPGADRRIWGEPNGPAGSNPAPGSEFGTGPGTFPGNAAASTVGQGNRVQPEMAAPKKYHFPPISLLQKGVAVTGDSERELRETAMHLQQTLSTFGVKVTITDISQGPSVTRYELQPEQGVKVSKIVGLTDDIKLNLAAMDIRIEAPIPGKAAIGIEVPNKETMPVGLRDLLETKEFSDFQSSLAFAVGKDIAGKVVVSDIAKMPHMLIAGATGSGKSVCINTLIMSILYKAHPDDVKMIMVDPKVVELSIYNGIPHLLVPVVTDPKKASAALHWGVTEMDDRYRKFAEYGARNLKEYNKKVEAQQKRGDANAPKKLPQIVIIVDELADLMMVCPGEVEASICRLAQLARACGIHLVIATQRPSVDVITGLIKANMPSRVAFSVSSGVDSRTILDMVGAEKLLGKGDMLFYPQGYPKPARVQGAFVSDQEVADVVDFLKNQALGNTYAMEIEEKITSMGSSAGESEKSSGGSSVDELFEKAGRLIIDKDKASIGMLQRALQIGFNRAARIMDQLCQYGVVGEEEGTKPRKILMSPEQFEQLLEEVA